MWDIRGCSPPWFQHYQLVGVRAAVISYLHPNSSSSWAPVFPSFLSTAPSPQLCRSPHMGGHTANPRLLPLTPSLQAPDGPVDKDTRGPDWWVGGRDWGLQGSEEGLLSSKTQVKLSHLQTLSPSNPTLPPNGWETSYPPCHPGQKYGHHLRSLPLLHPSQ